jgi:hypothetical protein
MPAFHRTHLPSVVLAALLATGCFNFHSVGPDQPDPYSPPSLVSVTIEYRQPADCLSSDGCDGPVLFWGSWMVRGADFSLVEDSTTRIWRGVALAVPVNFPPRTGAYQVRVYDPFLRAGPSAGMTSLSLSVGGESLRSSTDENTPQACGFIYIDSNGQGRNPF